jgi:hypothetical protein
MAFKIYKCSDKIDINVDGITITVSPLTYGQKMNLNNMLLSASQGDTQAAMDVIIATFKASIKGIKGLENEDGSEYKVNMIDGELSQDNIDDLLNLPMSNKISALCSSLLYGAPKDKILDMNGNVIEGISIVKAKGDKKLGKS